jgi:hypothetical protein
VAWTFSRKRFHSMTGSAAAGAASVVRTLVAAVLAAGSAVARAAVLRAARPSVLIARFTMVLRWSVREVRAADIDRSIYDIT